MLLNQLRDALRIAVLAGAGHHQRAPVISGQKHSHTDTSKLIGAFCISTSLSFRR
jgi:hypothetical protein